MTGHHGSKFGLPPAEARAVISDALALGLDVLGLHVHVGSQLPDFTAQAETIRRLAEFAASCRDIARLDGARRRPRRWLRHPPSPGRRDRRRRGARLGGRCVRPRGVRRSRPARAGGLARAGALPRGPRRRHALPRRRREAAVGAHLGGRRRRHVRQPAPAALRRAVHGARCDTRRRAADGERQRRGDALRIGRRAHRRRRAPLATARATCSPSPPRAPTRSP